MIQGGYMLGGASQSYSHTTRASPATVSAHPAPKEAGVGGALGRGSRRWVPATVPRSLGSLVPGRSGEEVLGLTPHCVASGNLLSLSGPQLIRLKLLELLPKEVSSNLIVTGDGR